MQLQICPSKSIISCVSEVPWTWNSHSIPELKWFRAVLCIVYSFSHQITVMSTMAVSTHLMVLKMLLVLVFSCERNVFACGEKNLVYFIKLQKRTMEKHAIFPVVIATPILSALVGSPQVGVVWRRSYFPHCGFSMTWTFLFAASLHPWTDVFITFFT